MKSRRVLVALAVVLTIVAVTSAATAQPRARSADSGVVVWWGGADAIGTASHKEGRDVTSPQRSRPRANLDPAPVAVAQVTTFSA